MFPVSNDARGLLVGECRRQDAALEDAGRQRRDHRSIAARTGRVTGAHLHYEILVSDRQVNPSSVKMTGGVELAGAEMKRFKAEVTRINALFKKSQQRPVAQVQNVSF